MAVVYKLDGVELDPENVHLRWNNDEEFEGAMAADGTGSFGSVIIHDPDGTLDVQGWMTFTIDETDCTDAPRLVTAWIWERDYARGGDEDTGAARTITCQLLDPNALLSLRVITGTDGNRPAETDGDRVDWLLGSDYLDGLVSDTGYVVYGTSDFDSENVIGQYPAEVLASIASAGISDRVFFAFYDQVAEAIGLFFDLPTATTYDCTLSISNVPADLGSTCFPPFDDVKLNRNPDAVYSDIRYVTKSGVYNRFDAATRATFFPSPLLRRGVNVENQRDGSASTSTRHADNYLAVHATERDTITVTIRVPSTQVGLIQAGMRMQIRLSHCPGYETATWARIERMSFHHAEGRRGFYDVTLNLTNKGLASNLGGSSGDPGDFPTPPPQTATHYASGRIEYMSEGSGTSAGVGATVPGAANSTTLVQGDASVTLTNFVTYNYSFTHTLDPLDLDTGHEVGLNDAGTWSSPHISTAGGVTTTVYTGSFTTGVDFLNAGTHSVTASAAGASHIAKAAAMDWWIDPDGWDTGEGAIPPAPGQWVYGEVVTMSGDTGTTTWPYADGSLVVRVDGVPISRASYTEDGATGDFTLSWTPDSDEVVTVDYQGR